MDTYQEQMEALGYSVGVALDGYTDDDGDHPTVYRVEGFGVSITVAGDDGETWERLLNPAAHAFRVRASGEGWETAAELMRASFDVAVALGDLSQDDADAAYDEWAKENA